MGIEPTLPAWEAGALPLSYTRIEALIDYTHIQMKSQLTEKKFSRQSPLRPPKLPPAHLQVARQLALHPLQSVGNRFDMTLQIFCYFLVGLALQVKGQHLPLQIA